jgi:crotonobetainyl-CoA:carnitine CoA-transferase CaiB-like acyl-CoA transferase
MVVQTTTGRTVIGVPVKLSRTPGQVASEAPRFGQHSREVLTEYGYSAADIESMIGRAVVKAVRSEAGEKAPNRARG